MDHTEKPTPCNVMPHVQSITSLTRSNGTVHTSTKAHLNTAATWQINISSRFMSVNHFQYLPIVSNPENNPYPDGDLGRH